MKTEICAFCLKSGILCGKCQAKLRSGEVSRLDIELGSVLLELEEKFPSLQDVSFYKAHSTDGLVAIVVGKDDSQAFTAQGGKILKELEKTLKKKVRVVERSGDVRGFLENLLAPVEIVTVSKIWIPDGTTEIRVILSGPPRKLHIDEDVIKELAKKVGGITVRIEFERGRRWK